MAILESLTNRAPAAGNGPLFQNRTPAGSARPTEDRQDAKVWLNIGYYVEIVGANGPELKFVNLPMGMPLDTMKPAKITGQNEDWIKLQTARNGLLDEMQKLGAQLKPGETHDLTQPGGLVIQLRRINESVEVKSNEYAVDLTRLMFGGQVGGTANQMAAE